ncbi:hypothetical protein HN419_03885 [Candidatus Woesearchaeota archaeon]|jgi:hypothetical protein|nr:hypothetical protein [Candidatus Woesearchaeota archaeon]MBT3537981.1 hypothetical protein [Candidatus Woesearchaeota archaeon]MBT4697336.1 hypothetical protein [Candidatus Woesearchaeota archaeon]MBT4717056.1 hypothetical protein [Candidatus Woesearchaeota archaeon]MBT7105650.1 hypothetical protein [Candidatus Woesearchaeota archaeon]
MEIDDHYSSAWFLLVALAGGIVGLFAIIGNHLTVFVGEILRTALGVIGLMAVSGTSIIVAMCVSMIRTAKG